MMKLVKIVRCKLEVDREGSEALRETVLRFSQACNDALKVALDKHITHPYSLHRELYYILKKRYKLTSNYVVRVFPRVTGAVRAATKRGHKPKLFRPKSLPLDKDLFRLIEYPQGQFRVSISTARGRRKFKLITGNYQAGMLTLQKPTSATISYNKRKRAWYINITLSTPVETPKPRPGGKVVGIDLGIANIATTSTGMRFSGKQAMHIRRRFRAKRAALQAKGTASAKRVLRRLAGREHRWMADLNHVISRRIMDSLQAGDVIVMEDLTHIRERAKQRRAGKVTFHSWAFGELQSFIEYKALERGIVVEYVDPYYTSQTCSRCGSHGSRSAHRFSCSCGLKAHADANASQNLRRAYVFAPSDGPSSTGPKATPSRAVAS